MSHVAQMLRPSRMGRANRVVAFLVVAVLVVATVLALDGGSRRSLTVDFPQTNSLYVGSQVKILGVAIGTVDDLEARGDVVRATISYDDDVTLPADVKAVIVSPAIVGDRFVQLAPAYTGGPELTDGAHLDVDRAAVPVELDQIYASLDDLSVALGPEGANADGALSSLVSDSAAQLDGQGAVLNRMFRDLGDLSEVLAGSSDDLFGSVREISDFVAMLKRNDAAVRAFNDNTAAVAQVLEGEREDLAATLALLGDALVDVESVVRENRGTLRTNVENLKVLAETLANREAEFAELTVAAPSALTNVSLAYNGVYGTLDVRADLLSSLLVPLTKPATLLCELLDETVDEGGLCATLAPILGALPLDQLTGILPRVAVAVPELSAERSDRTLAEMLGVAP